MLYLRLCESQLTFYFVLARYRQLHMFQTSSAKYINRFIVAVLIPREALAVGTKINDLADNTCRSGGSTDICEKRTIFWVIIK